MMPLIDVQLKVKWGHVICIAEGQLSDQGSDPNHPLFLVQRELDYADWCSQSKESALEQRSSAAGSADQLSGA